MTEYEAANTYTYRQGFAIAEFYIKDKFAVVEQMVKAFSMGMKGNSGGRVKRSLPSWYKGRRGHVVDLDGPLSEIMPYVGGVGAAQKTGG